MTRYFVRLVRKTDLTDVALCAAVSEMEAGLIDADLGAGVIKKRIASSGRGKSGGKRLLLGTNKGDRWFFLFSFAKSEESNVGATDLRGLQKYAADLLKLSPEELDQYVESKALYEICKTEEPDPRRGP